MQRQQSLVLQVVLQVARQGEGDGFDLGAHLLDLAITVVLQPGNHVSHQYLRHGCAGRDTDGPGVLEPLLTQLRGHVDAIRRARAVLQPDFNKANGVGRVRGTHDHQHVCARRNGLHGFLAVLGRVTDVVRGRIHQRGEPFPQATHRFHGFVDAQGGLGDPHDPLRVPHNHVVYFFGGANDLDVFGGLPKRALNFFVSAVTDQDDVVVLVGETHGLPVNLGDQRACRVNGPQVTHRSIRMHLRGNAVRGEDGDGPFWDLINLLNEDGAAVGQGLHDVFVVDDFLSHIHGGAMELQCAFHCFHRAVNACTVATWCGQKNGLGVLPARRSLRRGRLNRHSVTGSHVSNVVKGGCQA